MDKGYSLDNLRDIALPEPPPWWPPAPEVWWLLAIVAMTVFIVLFQWRRARQLNAYRRDGLALLGKAETAHDIPMMPRKP